MRTSSLDELRRTIFPARDRVMQEALVVALGEVCGTGVRAAALLARKPGLHHDPGEVEHGAELERLREISVEDVALVLDDDALVPLAEPLDDLELALHPLGVAEDAEVLEHRRTELVADLPRALTLPAIEQGSKIALGVCERRLRGDCVGPHERVLGRGLPGPAPERDRLHERVAAETIRTVNRDACDLAGGVQTVDLGRSPVVGGNAAHVVVGARPDGDRVVDRIDAGERHRQLTRSREPREDALGAEVAQIEQHGSVDATTALDLRRLRARDDIAGRELERVRRVARHEPLAVAVDEEAALAAAALRDEDAARVERRRVELHELHVLQRKTGVERHRHAVAVAGVRVRRRAIDATHSAGGENDRLPGDELETAVHEVPADDTDAAPVLDHETPCEVLLVHVQRSLLLALHQLLVEHVDEDVAGDVCRVDRARRARRAERPLRELPLVVPREDAAPVLELVDVAGRLVREDLDRVLVAEVVGALHRVECVRLRTVLRSVPERRVDPALGRAGVAPRGVQLRDDADVRARVEGLDGGTHAGAAGPDDDDVVHGEDAT